MDARRATASSSFVTFNCPGLSAGCCPSYLAGRNCSGDFDPAKRQALRRQQSPHDTGKARHLTEQSWSPEIVESPWDDQLLSTLQGISDDWLSKKNTAEKGFSLGFFQPDYIRGGPFRYP